MIVALCRMRFQRGCLCGCPVIPLDTNFYAKITNNYWQAAVHSCMGTLGRGGGGGRRTDSVGKEQGHEVL